MVKSKNDYPLVLTSKHVAEILDCSEPTARTYINQINASLKKEGKVTCKDFARIARVPRDKFFEAFGI